MDIIQESKEWLEWDNATQQPTLGCKAPHLSANDLISRLVDMLEELEGDNQILRNCMRNAKEVYISMDGFKPETAPEGYCLWLLEQMYSELCDKPLPPEEEKK